MRVWRAARRLERCGRCERPFTDGDALLVLQIGKLEKLRCVACAGYPPPEVLSTSPDKVPPPIVVPRLGTPLPYDFKIAQAGDREPGSDG